MVDADITQLQLLQQNHQQIIIQKQQFQKQLMEIESALQEIKDSSNTYKIVGNLMIAAKKSDLEKDLKEKQELIQLRIKIIQQQEEILQKQTQETQKKAIKK